MEIQIIIVLSVIIFLMLCLLVHLSSKYEPYIQLKEREKKIEKLAEYAHDAWSGWMKYMFGKLSRMDTNGIYELVITHDLVSRWTRQMNTEYKDLPNDERKSDIAEAEKIMKIIEEKE